MEYVNLPPCERFLIKEFPSDDFNKGSITTNYDGTTISIDWDDENTNDHKLENDLPEHSYEDENYYIDIVGPINSPDDGHYWQYTLFDQNNQVIFSGVIVRAV